LLREIPRKEQARTKGKSKRKSGNLNLFDLSGPQFHAISAVGGDVTSFETLAVGSADKEGAKLRDVKRYCHKESFYRASSRR
jgi:hypothetical protein